MGNTRRGMDGRLLPASEADFWAQVRKTETCWLWTGRTQRGYGQFTMKGRTWRAHRYCWERHHGAIPIGSVLCHACDNPLCVRPSHLFVGTHQDNVRDRHAKGRDARGERIGISKLTADTVRAIRADYPKLDTYELAEKYGIAQSHAHRIIKRQCWGWVT